MTSWPPTSPPSAPSPAGPPLLRLAEAEAEARRRRHAAAADRASREADTRLARKSLAAFLRAAWPVVEPGRPLVWGRHLDAVCEHLEAVTAGQILNLLITIPPGCTKPCHVGGLVLEKGKGLIPLGEVAAGDHVLTHRGRFRRVLAVHEQGVLPILEIATARGRAVRVHHTHPMLTARGWVEAGRLTERDVLAEVHPAEACGAATMPPEEARLLGYLIGDGSVKYAETVFTNQEPECVADFVACAARLGFGTAKTLKKGAYSATYAIRLVGGDAPARRRRGDFGAVRQWRVARGIEGKCSYTKRVPAAVLAADEATVAEFLAAYWACDGVVHDRRDLPRAGRVGQTTQTVRVTATTVSEGLARDLQHLLTRLGLTFTLSRKESNLATKRQGAVYVSWKLDAAGQDTAAKFMQVVGARMRHEKARRTPGLARSSFDRVLNPDPVRSVRPAGDGECRCLTVEEDSSFAYEGVAVHNSRTIGVFWPAWKWLSDPSFRWLFFSNEQELATRESTACRRLIESPWYRETFGVGWHIATDQNVKTWYETSAAGHRQALGVKANATGKKGDAVVVDDANDAEKVQGEADRKAVNDKWDNAIYDRVIDFKTGRRVVIGQRTHKNDLLGHIKATAPEFTELCIPEEFDPKRRYYTPIKWTDWRTEPGELLRPEQFGPAQAAGAKLRLGTIGYNAKHNQNPESPEGYRFKAPWLAGTWRAEADVCVLSRPGRPDYRFPLPEARARFGTADGAASVSTAADHTVICAWVVSPRNDLVWLGCRREKAEIPDQPAILRAEYDRHRLEWVDVEAVLSNRALQQHAARTAMNVKSVDPEGKDKLARATPAMVFCEAGRLYLPAAGEAPGYDWDYARAELLAFTGDEKKDEADDVVDNLSYAVRDLTRRFPDDGDDAGPGAGGGMGAGGGRFGRPGALAGRR